MIANPYSKQYYTSLREAEVGKEAATNGLNYPNRTRHASLKANSLLQSYSSDSEESAYRDDDADFNNYASSAQSSINCTPVPIHMAGACGENTALKITQAKSEPSDNGHKRRKKLEGRTPKMEATDGSRSFSFTPKRNYGRDDTGAAAKAEPSPQKNAFDVTTPDVTRRASAGLKHADPDFNIDSAVTTYVDSMFGVEPYKYVHEHQPLTLFWLHNSELSGLMMVPTLSSLSNELCSTEKVYMVFTDYSIDIVQDVSNLNMITPREGYTPFVVIYSYNLKSMYFKVVKRSTEDVSMVSFNKSCNDLNDCLTLEPEDSPPNAQTARTNGAYEFYRSYLYGKDDCEDPNRLRVFVHPSNKTNFDLRYLSVNSYARWARTIRREYSGRSAMSDTNWRTAEEGDDEAADLSDGATSNESPFAFACQNSSSLDLPDELFEECKLLVGGTDSTKHSGHPDSVANYRSESAIKKNFTVYLCDEENEELTSEVLAGLTKVRDEGNVIYRAGELALCARQTLKIVFPTIYARHFEHDYITLYPDATLKSCFNFIKSLQPEDCLSVNINKLAQFCPNLFWNLALTGDIETTIIELDPDVLRSLYKRKRTTNADADPYAAARPKPANSLGYLDNNFIIMQNLFKRDADEKIKRLRENERNNGAGARSARVVINKHAEEEALVKLLMDEHGFAR